MTSQEISLPLQTIKTPQLYQNFVIINKVKLLDMVRTDCKRSRQRLVQNVLLPDFRDVKATVCLIGV